MNYVTNNQGVCLIVTPKTTIGDLYNHLGSMNAVSLFLRNRYK